MAEVAPAGVRTHHTERVRELVLPGYEMLDQLGAGGFGEVRLARHRVLGRLVAVKRLRSFALEDDGATDRFRREARALAMLDCPQIVRVYDYRSGDGPGGAALLVMEYVPGRPLDEMLAQGPLGGDRAVRLLGDVAAALDAAAARGIVHRDVKSANVFVLPDGSAKLGDFGLARITGDSSAFRTAAGLVTGTPAYLAPEVTAGGEPDVRADAYSFAVLAYECLVGRLPFDARSLYALAAAHADQEPPRPTTLLPGFPAAAEEALLAGLAKDPAARPLPARLVAELARADWSAVVGRLGGDGGVTPLSADARTRAVTPRSAAIPEQPAPLPTGSGVALPAFPRPTGTGRRHGHRLTLLVATGLAVGAVAGAVGLAQRGDDGGAEEPLAVDRLTVTTVGSGQLRCPSDHVEFVAGLVASGGGGRLELRWTRPDGSTVPPVFLEAPAGTSRPEARLRYDISGERPLTGRARLVVVGARTGQQLGSAESMPIAYRCP